MSRLFDLFWKSQEVQLRWIRNHPFQYIALNAILIVGGIGYTKYQDRLAAQKLEQENKNLTSED